MSEEIPSCAWSILLSKGPTKQGRPRRIPLKLLLKMFPVVFRLRKWKKLAGKDGNPPVGFNAMKTIDDGYNQGVPIGGFGSGSIGRTYRGDFARWHLNLGEHHHEPSEVNQFHLRVEKENDVFVQTLNPRRTAAKCTSWKWGMDATKAEYSALFPRAWTVYDFEEHGVKAVCKQISPIIGHNYIESSYPVGVFVFSLTNTSNASANASVMLTWENGLTPSQEPHKNDFSMIQQPAHSRILVQLGRAKTDKESSFSFGLGIDCPAGQVSAIQDFSVDSHEAIVWDDFVADGLLSSDRLETDGLTKKAAALCGKVRLEPYETREMVFSLSWDIPVFKYGQGREWYRRYTRFFNTNGDNAQSIAEMALETWKSWEKMITEWQKPTLELDTPSWFRGALFNELYYLVDGCSGWETGSVEFGLETEGIGRFGYLECFDYPFVNTYDVHFYASFALVLNWPEIDNAIQRDYARTVMNEDSRRRMLLFEEGEALRKPRGAIPHDLGMPAEDPWIAINAYNAQDVGRWKDLNTKFVLQVYRNYVLTQDREFLEYCWEPMKAAMAYIDEFDKDMDGLPENEGFPDQTYDVWVMKGPSAYCGGLYLAAAQVMAELAEEFKDPVIAEKYREIFHKGKQAYIEKLWNGQYFNYDAGESKHSNSIMTDQLAGQLYMHASNLPRIVEAAMAKKALNTIFEYNVMRYADGNMGAMNGMRPDGTIDTTSMQSAEVWTGTSYATAALMVHEGLIEEGWKTAQGVYKVTYEDRGYWFRTPEAWTEDGNFRASMYMRPLAIWAIAQALLKRS